MLTRRTFLKGLIASVASATLIKNGVAQPEQAIVEPKRNVFDMAANTWREQLNTHHIHFTQSEEVFRYEWGMPPEHVNCRCVTVPVLRKPLVTRWLSDQTGIIEEPIQFDQMAFSVPKHLDNTIVGTAIAEIKAKHRSLSLLPSWGITAEEIQACIDEIAKGAL